MRQRDPLSISEILMARLKDGLFLTVKSGDVMNTMTIGWGLLGLMWQRPYFVVPVRNSRYTFSIIEKASDFTVTLPTEDMKEAILLCGTKSGRDLDKLKACKLKTIAAQRTTTPILDIAGIHLECCIRYKNILKTENLDPSLTMFYPDKDYHTHYFGEILECYETGEIK